MKDRTHQIFSHVNYVDLFPDSKRAEIEYTTDEGDTTYERLGAVWEAVFDGAVVNFKTCSFVRMVYGGQGVCVWDSKNMLLTCKKESCERP